MLDKKKTMQDNKVRGGRVYCTEKEGVWGKKRAKTQKVGSYSKSGFDPKSGL